MMQVSAGKLSRDNLRQVLASVGSMAADLPGPEYREFDWHACRYFSVEQLEQLNTSVKPFGTTMADVFEGFCHRGFAVTIQPVRQISGSALVQEVAQADAAGYSLLLGSDLEEPTGVFWMPAKTASLWGQWLLGDGDAAEETESGISALEQSLLCDLITAYVGALGEINPVFDLQSESKLASGGLPEQWDPSEGFVKIVHEVKPTDAERASEAILMLSCATVAGLMGPVAQKEVTSDEDYSSLIMASMHGLPVSMTVRLNPVILTLAELMSLRPNDVLVLDQRIEQGLDVLMDGRVVFRASPGKSRGKQAVLITDCVVRPQVH